jgi:hypothetical protein
MPRHDALHWSPQSRPWFTAAMKETILAVTVLALSPGVAAQIPPSGIIGPGETVTIGAGEEVRRAGPIVVAGGRLLVTGGKLFLNGTMTIVRGGAVVFDAAEFHHEGEDTHVFVGGLSADGGDGSLSFRNGSRLHWAQSYVSQHELHGRNASVIELEQTRVDCDAATGVIKLHDNATFSARLTTAAKAGDLPGCWSTWYLHQSSTLRLDSVHTAGDIVFYDAARIEARDVLGIMPWLYFPRGSVADLSFPDSECTPESCPAVSKALHGSTGWTVEIEESRQVFWGLNTYPGSDVTVRDSRLGMAMVRFAEDQRYFVPGEFRNETTYEDKTFASLHDRRLRLVSTHVKWWKLDVIDLAQARMDGVAFSEMVTKSSARAFLTNSICEGQTIHLGALDNSYLYFKDGEVWTHVSAWNQAFLVLDGSLVDHRKAPVPHQIRNVAHNRARIYALNSELVSPLEAMESALATFARLGSYAERELQAAARTPAPVGGSAWIVKGPGSKVALERWILVLRAPGAQNWVEIGRGTQEVRDAHLATIHPMLIWWPGEYELRLTLVVRGDDPDTAYPTWAFPALKKLVVK